MYVILLVFRQYGDHKHCRRVYQRALRSVTDHPEFICTEYLKFEREEGALSGLYLAKSRVHERRQQVSTEGEYRGVDYRSVAGEYRGVSDAVLSLCGHRQHVTIQT